VRRRLFGCLAVIALLLAACSGSPASQEPVKVGFLGPLTGSFGATGQTQLNAIKMYLEEHGNKIGGRPATLIAEDSEGKADVGLTKAKKLVESNSVDVVIGPYSSAVCFAIRDYMEAMKKVWFANCGHSDMTGSKSSKYFFRDSTTSLQSIGPGIEYVVKDLGLRRFATIGLDYAGARDNYDVAKPVLDKMGAQVVTSLWSPLGTADYAPFLTQIDPTKVDVVWALIWGADGVRFVRQYEEFGLKSKLPLFVMALTVPEIQLPQMGDSAIGLINSGTWIGGIETSENQSFLKAYRAKYNEMPADVAVHNYIAMMAVDKAATSLDGKLSDSEAFIKALEKVQLTTPSGKFQFDEKHNPVRSVFIGKVQKKGAEYWNVPVREVTGVSQSWQPK